MERAVAFIGKANCLELRLDTSASFDDVLNEIDENLEKNANFFSGTPYVKVLGNLEEEQKKMLENVLKNGFGFEKVYFSGSEVESGVSLFTKKITKNNKNHQVKRIQLDERVDIDKPSFFQNEASYQKSNYAPVYVDKKQKTTFSSITSKRKKGNMSDVDKIKKAQEKAKNLPFEMGVLDQKAHNVNDQLQHIKENASLSVFETVRSGQTVKYDGDIIVFGEVNRGAELIASGNITVMGILRGNAHAGSAGDESAIVAAFKLLPQKLRIGTYMAVAPDDDNSNASRKPEYAFVEDCKIVIKNLGKRKNK